MKNILFLLFIAFSACNNTAETNPATTENTTTASASTAPAETPKPRAKRNLENPDINIQVSGLAAGGEASLIGVFTGNNFKAAVSPISGDGKFNFKRDEPYEPGMYFVLLPDNRNFQILVDEDQTFSLKTTSADLLNSMVVEGSSENQLLYNNLRYEADYQKKFNDLTLQMNNAGEGTSGNIASKKARQSLIDSRKVYLNDIFEKNPKSFFTSFKRGGQNPDLRVGLENAAQVWHYRRDFWESVDFNDERLLRTPVISNKLKRYITELTPQQPDSIIASAKYITDKVLPYPEYFKYFANFITLNYDQKESTLMDAHAVEVFMIQNYFTNERAFWSDSVQVFGLQQQAYEKQASLVGKKGKNVIANGPDGKQYSLYDIKADYTIVYMFNPDCEHCQEETPKLVDFYKKWKSKGVEVFTIGLDTDDIKWKNYLNKVGATNLFTNVYDSSNRAIYPNWYVDVTPELYVLNKDKVIIAKNLKVNQIETVIEQDKER
ncbi:MAG: thiol-disulfide isomerase/thioredoxin [Saprospiraceae bacterium]|jgi:thiol-disulfide isomerase/thioredoxin